MYQSLGKAQLKTGETVEIAAVKGPAGEWLDPIEKMLGHKSPIWDWQNSVTLRQDVGIDVYYYILHRDGKPFSNIMTAEIDGVGLFGHVWTNPDDRRKGAASIIMEKQMQHFRDRDGKMLSLGTGYDTPPYHIYAKYGFAGVEAQNGYMTYFSTSKEQFENEYFAKGPTEIQSIDWKHWPTAPALFLSSAPGSVRCAPIGLLSRSSSEGPMIHLLVDRYKDPKNSTIRASALVQKNSGGFVGLAAYGWDRQWADTVVVDVWCHPNHWDRAGELLASLTLPETMRYVGYADGLCPSKRTVLEAAGFKAAATLPNWIGQDYAKIRFTDVTVFEKR